MHKHFSLAKLSYYFLLSEPCYAKKGESLIFFYANLVKIVKILIENIRQNMQGTPVGEFLLTHIRFSTEFETGKVPLLMID